MFSDSNLDVISHYSLGNENLDIFKNFPEEAGELASLLKTKYSEIDAGFDSIWVYRESSQLIKMYIKNLNLKLLQEKLKSAVYGSNNTAASVILHKPGEVQEFVHSGGT